MSDWRPTAAREALESRARLVRRIRGFFEARGVLEVETPLLSRAATPDLAVESLPLDTDGEVRYLHTSPEFPMKRLLAAGSGDIYQICKVFRAGERGRQHNPEFTLLEWYRLGFDHHALMAEVECLLRDVLGEFGPSIAAERLSYREAFVRYAGVDPLIAPPTSLADCAAGHGVQIRGALSRDQWLDLLLSHVVAPAFPANRFTFLYDYPASQAALARIRPDEPPIAERFEVFRGALELANGFHELTDSVEQRARFKRDQATRRSVRAHVPPLDEHLLQALAHGLPDCAGVAVGIDRLVMLAADVESITGVIAFPWDRV